jgi:hypothetical protein
MSNAESSNGRKQLTYRGHDLGFECQVNDECECAYCDSIRFMLEGLSNCLCIAIENDSREHYNWLITNLQAMAEAAKIQLEKQQEERVVH